MAQNSPKALYNIVFGPKYLKICVHRALGECILWVAGFTRGACGVYVWFVNLGAEIDLMGSTSCPAKAPLHGAS